MSNETLVLQIQRGEQGVEPLWDNVKKLVRSFAFDYYTKGCEKRADIDLEDLMQEGFFGVLDAINAYKPENGYLFTTYLTYHCRNRFNKLAGIRSESERKDPVRRALRNARSLDAPVLSDDEEITLLDMIPDASTPHEDAEEKIYYEQAHKDLEAAMQGNPDADVVRLQYWDGMTLEQVAQATGTTKDKVRTVRARCLQKMRKAKVLKPYKDFMQDNFFLHVGVNKFHSTGFSAVETIAFNHLGKNTHSTTREKLSV